MTKDTFLAKSAVYLLSLCIVFTLIQMVNFFYQEKSTSKLIVEKVKSNSLSDVSSSVSKEENITDVVSKMHLFGHSLAGANNIPLSALNLKLTGIFYTGSEKDSKVSIVYNGQEEKLYGLNDTLPNGVIIERIFPSEVIIKYNGDLQKLALYQKDNNS